MTDVQLRSIVAAVALAGAAIAAYLTYARYSGARIACATGGCETVQSSSYAKFAGVPVAVLGLLAYAAIFASALSPVPAAAAAGAALSIGGFGFSLYLLYAQVFEIDAICQWCIASDVVLALLVVASALRLHRVLPAAVAT